jgi:hypothetical protein
VTVEVIGRLKVEFVRRLGHDWADLADLVGIQRHERDRFVRGDEARAIWEWLDEHGRLPELAGVLGQLGRDDLANEIGHQLDVAAVAVAVAVPLAAPISERPRARWTLDTDPELATHWLTRARGADPDAAGTAWNFSGREVAVARIAAFLPSQSRVSQPVGGHVLRGYPGQATAAGR